MPEYTYTDFMNTLDDKGAFVLNTLNNHIAINYPEYKPFDIKPTDKSNKEWRLHYRKKPKVGKAIFSAYSEGGKLSVRFCLLSFMAYEFLLRQNEFSAKFKTNVLQQMLCSVMNVCRNYGGNTVCQVRQHYWINNRLIIACPYPWVSIDNYDENSVTDMTLFTDIQMKHMAQDAKEIKGASYTEETVQRCKEVQTIFLNGAALDVDTFFVEDHVKKPERLNKYKKLYSLVPMGANEGLWYYHDTAAVCGIATDEYNYTEIPEGCYAVVTVNDPFAFSAWRVWNHVVKWLNETGKSVRPIELGGKSVPYFVKFYRQSDVEYMAMYVRI